METLSIALAAVVLSGAMLALTAWSLWRTSTAEWTRSLKEQLADCRQDRARLLRENVELRRLAQGPADP